MTESRRLSAAPEGLELLLHEVRSVEVSALELGPGDRAKVVGALAEAQARLLLTPVAGLEPDRCLPVAAVSPRLLSAQEAGERLGKSKWWIYRNRKTLPHLVVGSEFRFPSEKLDQWTEGRTRLTSGSPINPTETRAVAKRLPVRKTPSRPDGE